MDDNFFMELANLEAENAIVRGDYPCGCIIVRNGEIVAKASAEGNTKKDAVAHAEILAIRKACRKLGTKTLDHCVLYTNIEPCLMCAKAMVYAKIKKVVYGTEHKEYGDKKTFDILKQNGIAEDIEVVSGLQKEKASKLLNTFLRDAS
jgi:tRNA(adenine34) deaminase